MSVTTNRTADYLSPLGRMTMVSDEDSLLELHFADRKRRETAAPASKQKISVPLSLFIPASPEVQDLPIFEQTKKWLDSYFHGETPVFTPQLRLQGTEFQIMVWEILLAIPYGQTVTYGEIAARIAAQKGLAKMSAQAVGGAVGSNPIALIVPCHRVVGAQGKLTGYAGGLERKAKLLELETHQAS